jgi:hypothetical protein
MASPGRVQSSKVNVARLKGPPPPGRVTASPASRTSIQPANADRHPPMPPFPAASLSLCISLPRHPICVAHSQITKRTQSHFRTLRNRQANPLDPPATRVLPTRSRSSLPREVPRAPRAGNRYRPPSVRQPRYRSAPRRKSHKRTPQLLRLSDLPQPRHNVTPRNRLAAAVPS